MSEYVCMLLSIIWVFFQITAGACPDGSYGLDCNYTCHCTSGCDDVKGCSGNCKMGSSGPKCTIHNVALNKTAYQSSYYQYYKISASHGVDGNYTTAILTDVTPPYTWWEVDLGEEHYIHNVTIHFRNDGSNYRRNGVEVYTSLQPNQTNTGQLCGNTTINSPDVTRMTCDHVARYVTLYQGTNNDKLEHKHNSAGTAMDFKEVEVFICDAGTFGSNCTKFCHCQDKPCNYSTGQCGAGCQQNWTGQHCDGCDTNHYGLLCSGVCSDRHCDETNGKSTCNGIPGQCVNGCDPGWTGVDCTHKCPSGSYGKDCKELCSKRHCYENSGCDHVTGKCVNGCDRGYESLDCTKQCHGTYGFNCKMYCTSRKCNGSSGCDPSYGNCTDGCVDGVELPDCVQECRSGTFGARCRLKCSDRRCHGDNTTCDAVSGTCQHGCKPGWKTPSCLKPCDAGRYGDGCASDCTNRHCLNKTASCDHVTGSCDGACEESWKGGDCTGCDGKYGKDCRYSCLDRKCRDTSAPCDHVKGSCKGKCQDGWQGDTCTTKCNGTYGQDCKSSCDGRHCKDNTICDHITGACSGPCLTGWQGDACVTAASDTGLPVGLIAGVVAAAVVVLVVAVILVVFIRRGRRRKRPLESDSGNNGQSADSNVYVNLGMAPTSKEQPKRKSNKISTSTAQARNEAAKGDKQHNVKGSNPYRNVNVSESDVEADEKSDDDQTGNDDNVQYCSTSHCLPEEGFDIADLENIIQRIRNQRGGFESEFLKLPSGFKHPYTESQKAQHKGKNRFVGYYPYDNNRVVLSKLPNNPNSDYINASHMDAYNKKNFFIAAQAPREGTVLDFWRMIWEKDCGQIVMLTNHMEAGKHKCEPYWDDNKPMTVAFFNITVKEAFNLAEYTIRKIQVTQTKSGKLTQKMFDHYHFTSWPDHGVPNVLDLLDFLWKTRDTPRPRPGPVLVHCSAGIGRTGTYIALHILIDEMNATGRINILQTLTQMRSQRKNMIQTKEQYECVFKTLLEVVKYGQTSMTTNEYLKAYPANGGNMTMGRKTIDQLAEDIVSMNIPYSADAPVKNRLWVNGQQDQFVVGAPSKMLKQGYLLAHTPYKTENLLWKLITDDDSLTLITLGKETGLEFIPHPSHICEYGRVTVATVNETSITTGVTMRTLSVGKTSDSEKKEIVNYSVDLWSDDSDESSVIEYLIILMEQIEQRQKKLESHPITIVSNPSDSQKAVWLCIMNNVMSTMTVDKEVEIFNNVRRFQDVLPNVKFTEETFKFVCQLAFVYLESTGVYANM